MSSYYPPSSGGGEPANHLHHQTHHRPLPADGASFVPIDLNEDATFVGLPRSHTQNPYSYAPNSFALDQASDQMYSSSGQAGGGAGGPNIEMTSTNSFQTNQRADQLPSVATITAIQHNHPVPHATSSMNPASNGQHSRQPPQQGQPSVTHHYYPQQTTTSPVSSSMPNSFSGPAVPIPHAPPNPQNLRKVRRWRVFPGRNRFFCNGRIVMAKQISVFYFTLTLLTCTCILFFIFDCPYLATHVSFAIPAVAGVLFVFVLCTLLRTSFSDPGIIPRATPEEAADVERQIIPNRNNSPTYRPPPRTKEVIINNQPIKLKYCFTCKIFRPPRASHCSLCDNCVERFDHHCPWVGNCVGKRNYRFFYMFIVSLAFLCIYVFACIVAHLVLLSKDSSMTEAIKKSPVSMVEAIICFFSVWSILGLAGFHTYLIFSNLTTNEDIKGSFSTKRTNSVANPYSAGSAFSNCYSILCTPLSPSLIQPRTYVYCDEQILSQSRHSNSESMSGLSGASGPPRLMPRPSLNPTSYPIQPQYPNIAPASAIGGPTAHQHNSVDSSAMHQNSSDFHYSGGHKGSYAAYGPHQTGPMEIEQSKQTGKPKIGHHHSHGHSHHHPLPPCVDHVPSSSECESYMTGGSGSCRSQPPIRKNERMMPEMYYNYDQPSANKQAAASQSLYLKKPNPSTHPNPCEPNLRSNEFPSATSYSASMAPYKPSGNRLHQQRGSMPAAFLHSSGESSNRSVLGSRSAQAGPGLSRPKDYGMLPMVSAY